MLDSIPRSLWLEYWFRRNWPTLIGFAFWLSPLLVFGLYYPITYYLIQQEARVVVNVSNLTVFYVLFLFYMAHFANQLLNKFTSGKPYIVRLAGLFLFILALVFFLGLIGMEMRWQN